MKEQKKKGGAPLGNKNAEGNTGGAPTLYKPEYAEQAYRVCLLGATNENLALFFDVAVSTIHEWRNTHVEFSDAIRRGKIAADVEVAGSLFGTTKDRTIIKQVPFKTKNVFYNDEGKRIEREGVEIIEVKEVIPADFRAQQFWLKNRQPKDWKDKQEVDHTSGGQRITQPAAIEIVNPNGSK